jgi:hypothetical protein
MPEDIYWDYCAFLNFLHAGMLVYKTGTHKVGSFKYKFQRSFIRSEARIHFRIGMNSFEGWYTVIAYENEMGLFVYDYMLATMVFASFQLVTHYLCFLGK